MRRSCSATWGCSFSASGSALMAYSAKQRLELRATQLHQPASRRRWVDAWYHTHLEAFGLCDRACKTIAPEEPRQEFESRVRGFGAIAPCCNVVYSST
jgi:hypothetical protein